MTRRLGNIICWIGEALLVGTFTMSYYVWSHDWYEDSKGTIHTVNRMKTEGAIVLGIEMILAYIGLIVMIELTRFYVEKYREWRRENNAIDHEALNASIRRALNPQSETELPT